MKYEIAVTYEVWDDESVEIGETDDRGYYSETEQIKKIKHIGFQDLTSWEGLSDSTPARVNNFWIYGSDGMDMYSGETTNYALHIKKLSGESFTQKEIDKIKKLYHIR